MILRALLNAIGLGRAAAPMVEPVVEPAKPAESVAPGPLAHLASLLPGQDISAVLATLPDAPKGRRGRPYAYPQDRAASPAERQRRRYWRAKGKARREPHENDFRESHENPPLKEEEKKERAGAPISKDWRPDADGERLGKEVFGKEYEAQVADHIDYCLKTDFRCHDHDANWRRRCRALQRNPQLRLDLHGPQLDVVKIIPPNKKRGTTRPERHRTVQDVARELAEKYRAGHGDIAPTPSSEEDKEKVRESLERFRRGQSKEASG